MASWITELFKDIATANLAPHMTAAQLYHKKDKGDEDESNFGKGLTEALTGSRFSEWPEYILGKRDVRSSQDAWKGAARLLSTGLGSNIDEAAWKYGGPAITGYFGGPLAGAAGGALGQKLSGESDKDALMGAIGGALAGYGLQGLRESGGLSSLFSGGSEAAAGTGGDMTVSNIAPSTSTGPTVETAAGSSWYDKLIGNIQDTFKGVGENYSKNPNMFYNLMGRMGTNLQQGKPAMQGVPEYQARSNIAASAARRQELQRQQAVRSLLRELAKQSRARELGLLTRKGDVGGEKITYSRDNQGRLIATMSEILPNYTSQGMIR